MDYSRKEPPTGIGAFGELDASIERIEQSGSCSVYRVQPEQGEGTLTVYELAPGITIFFYDFSDIGSMQSYFSLKSNSETLVLDYCREGCLEWNALDGKKFSLGAGDMCIDDRMSLVRPYSFPNGFYRGLSVEFDIDSARASLDVLSPSGFPVDLTGLRETFCSPAGSYVFRGDPTLVHIFCEIYSAPEPFREAYFELKVMEALLFLGQRTPDSQPSERPLFSTSQIEKIHAIRDALIADLSKDTTLEELSEHFGFPYTSMQKCFREVYGMPIHAYLRQFRMSQATVLLRESNLTIAEIALRMGYSNPSKFAAAFREAIGMLPSEYRAG